MDPVISAGKDERPWFMEPVLPGHTIIRGVEDMAATIV